MEKRKDGFLSEGPEDLASLAAKSYKCWPNCWHDDTTKSYYLQLFFLNISGQVPFEGPQAALNDSGKDRVALNLGVYLVNSSSGVLKLRKRKSEGKNQYQTRKWNRERAVQSQFHS